MSRVQAPQRPEMTSLASEENALASYTRTPPRNIKIDPESARTVIHEIHARHRGPPRSDDSQYDDSRRAPSRSRINREDDDRKAGILPDRHHYTPPRRSKSRHRRRNYETDSNTDSESDGYLKPQNPRRRRRSNSELSRSSNANHGSKRPSAGRRYSNEIVRYEERRDLDLAPNAHSRSSRHDSESDSDYDSEAHKREKRAARNKKLVYTGLAGVTTLAAVNGIYQNAKGFHGRRKALKEAAEKGELEDEEEARKRRNKHLMMDAFALLVVGVGVNNARVGWQRREEKKKAHDDAEQKEFERFERRERGSGRDRAYSVEER